MDYSILGGGDGDVGGDTYEMWYDDCRRWRSGGLNYIATYSSCVQSESERSRLTDFGACE